MARTKKKTVKQTQTEKNVNSVVSYAGKVTVKYVDKNGKSKTSIHHNAGQLDLLCLITRMLGGRTTSDYMPIGIQGYYKPESTDTTNDDTKDNKAFATVVPIGGQALCFKKITNSTTITWVQSDTGCSKVQFSVIVTPQYHITTKKVYKLKLVNSRFNDPTEVSRTSENETGVIAQVVFTDAEAITLKTNTNILIEWELMFDNIQTKEGN